MDDTDYDIPGVHPELIDNDDIFSPKLWEILATAVAALILYLVEARMLWW